MARSKPTSKDAALAEILAALAHPVRVALLRVLQEPRALSEIVMEAPPQRETESDARPLTRQAIRYHLDALLRTGAVVTTAAEASTPRYLVNPTAVYAVSEAFRQLARLRPISEVAAPTVVGREPIGKRQLPGQVLIVVKGPQEGRTFDLRTPDQPSEWVIGRSRAADVPLEHDGRVSARHALVRLEDGAYSIEDLPESKNGTWVNFSRLEPLDRHQLSVGDVILIGQTILLFRP